MKKYKNTWKIVFLNNLELSLSAREKSFSSFKSRLFPIKNLDIVWTREPTPGKATKPEAEPTPKLATPIKPEIYMKIATRIYDWNYRWRKKQI